MIFDILGWVCTAMVLIGFIYNSNGHLRTALVIWGIGDIGWIIYDIKINNWSHAALSLAIILINIYGLIRTKYGKA